MGKSENYGMMLSIMRRHCKECHVEGEYRLHTLNEKNCETCCIPGVIMRGMIENGVEPEKEELIFFTTIATKIIGEMTKETEAGK